MTPPWPAEFHTSPARPPEGWCGSRSARTRSQLLLSIERISLLASVTDITNYVKGTASDVREKSTVRYRSARDWFEGRKMSPWGSAALYLLAAIAIIGAIWLLAFLLESARDLLTAGGDSISDGGQWIAAQPAVEMFTDPINGWFTKHAADLPVTAGTLAALWLTAGSVLFGFAVLRSRGAQLGWTLYGAGSTAMAWQGTTVETHRPVVAGAVVLAWCLLSVLALRRSTPTRVRPVPYPVPAAAAD